MDLDAYRQKLRARIDGMNQGALGVDGTGRGSFDTGESVEPLPGQDPPNTPPFTDTGEGPWVDDEGGGVEGGLPVSKPMAIETSGGAGPQMQPAGASPDFQPKFNEKKLEGAKTFVDVLQAMKPGSRSEYMDWWEGQYGSINAKWDALQSELGQRPDPKGKLSRKEKFELLMEFGLELMRASQPGQDQGGGATTAAYNAVRNTQAGRQRDQQNWDIKNQLLTQGRQKDLAAIGNRGQAMVGQSKMDTDLTTRAKNEAIANRPPKKQTLVTDQGILDISGEQPQRMTIDGKPLTKTKVSGAGTNTYQLQWDNAVKRNMRTLKMTREQAEDAATKELSPLRAQIKEPNKVKLLDQASKTAARRLGTANNWEFNKPDDDDRSYTEALEAETEEEYQRLLSLDGVGNGAIPKVTTPEEYAELSSGTEYIAPNGKTYRKK